jgi:SNF2 family DNA or RNA helicase
MNPLSIRTFEDVSKVKGHTITWDAPWTAKNMRGRLYYEHFLSTIDLTVSNKWKSTPGEHLTALDKAINRHEAHIRTLLGGETITKTKPGKKKSGRQLSHFVYHGKRVMNCRMSTCIRQHNNDIEVYIPISDMITMARTSGEALQLWGFVHNDTLLFVDIGTLSYLHSQFMIRDANDMGQHRENMSVINSALSRFVVARADNRNFYFSVRELFEMGLIHSYSTLLDNETMMSHTKTKRVITLKPNDSVQKFKLQRFGGGGSKYFILDIESEATRPLDSSEEAYTHLISISNMLEMDGAEIEEQAAFLKNAREHTRRAIEGTVSQRPKVYISKSGKRFLFFKNDVKLSSTVVHNYVELLRARLTERAEKKSQSCQDVSIDSVPALKRSIYDFDKNFTTSTQMNSELQARSLIQELSLQQNGENLIKMVHINPARSGHKLEISFTGDKFMDLVETSKHIGLRYSPANKVWEGEVPLLQHYIDEFSVDDAVDVSAYTYTVAEEYAKKIQELKTQRRRINWDLMKLPPLVGKPPYEDFQKVDTMRAFNQNRFLWNARMGLGKSYMISAVLVNLLDQGLIEKAILFSSNIGLYNVKNEVLKFTHLLDTDVLVVSSIGDYKGDDRMIFDAYPDKKLYVMTYDSIKYVADAYYRAANPKSKKIPAYRHCPIKWTVPAAMFFDECHLIGSPDSRRFKVIQSFVHRFEYRYFSSGTPMDKYNKLWGLSTLIDPSLTGGLSYHSWLAQHVQLGNRFSKYAINENTWDLQKLDALNKKLLNYSSKRGIECLNVPEQYVKEPIVIPMSEQHREIYQAFSYFVIDKVFEASKQNGAGVAANLTNNFQFAHLACDNPKLLLDNEHFTELDPELQKKISSFNYSKEYSKLRVLDDIIETHCDEQDEKIIVWYYHPKTLVELEKHLAKRKPFVVSSKLTNQERVETVEAFKTSDSKIIIMSIASANSSTTLVEAKAMAFYETSWVYTDYDQSTGRIQRPGQDQSTVVYNIRFGNSIDCLQLKNLQTKGGLVNSLLSRDSLAKEDWKRIFNCAMDTQI